MYTNTISMCLITCITVWVCFRNIARMRIGLWNTLMAITVMTGLTYVLGAVLNIEFLVNISAVAVPIFFTCKKNDRIIAASVFYSLLTMLVLLVVANIIGTITVLMFSTNITDAKDSMPMAYSNNVFCFFLAYPVSFIVGRFLHAKLNTLTESFKKKLYVYMSIGAAIAWGINLTNVFLLNYINDYYIKETISTLLIIVYFIFILIALHAFVVRLQAETELENKEKLLEQLHIYTSSLETISDEMRKFRQDHVNMLSGLFGYVDNNNTEGLRNYLAKYISPFTANIRLANASLDKLRNIKIPELKGVVLVKLIHAQELGIHIHIEVYDEIVSLNFDLVDLCRIVGILLDNAIESFDSETDIDSFELRFGVVKKDASTQLIFENTVTNPIPMARIFEKGFSTKSDERGLGLYIVKQIIDKRSSAYILAEARNGLFSIIIDIAND